MPCFVKKSSLINSFASHLKNHPRFIGSPEHLSVMLVNPGLIEHRYSICWASLWLLGIMGAQNRIKTLTCPCVIFPSACREIPPKKDRLDGFFMSFLNLFLKRFNNAKKSEKDSTLQGWDSPPPWPLDQRCTGSKWMYGTPTQSAAWTAAISESGANANIKFKIRTHSPINKEINPRVSERQHDLWSGPVRGFPQVYSRSK